MLPVAAKGTFTDSRDDQTYTWVRIGDQVWMAENLRYLPAAMAGVSSSSTNPSRVQGVCPPGWHVPSHDEWTQLERSVCETLNNIECDTKFPYDNETYGRLGIDEANALAAGGQPLRTRRVTPGPGIYTSAAAVCITTTTITHSDTASAA